MRDERPGYDESWSARSVDRDAALDVESAPEREIALS